MFTPVALSFMSRYALFILLFLLSYVGTGCNSKPETQGENQSRQSVSTNHTISLEDAVKFTGNFRSSVPSGAVLAESFGEDAIREIIDQTGCVGVRIYYGKKDDESPAMVLVGTDSTGKDMTGGRLVETGFPCPPVCDALSALVQ